GAATFTLRQTVGQQDPTSFPVTVLPDPTNVGLDDLLLDLNRAIQTAAVEAGINTTVTAQRRGSRIVLVAADNADAAAQVNRLSLTNPNDITQNELGFALPQAASELTSSREQLQALLPDEKEVLAIIVDALDGDDRVIVGPTVLTSVWVDAGAGHDYVEIVPGVPLLADQFDEQGLRNDVFARAAALGEIANDSGPFEITGLTLDNPDDADWFGFQLAGNAAPDDVLRVQSLSDQDRVTLEIHDATNPADPLLLLSSQQGTQIDLYQLLPIAFTAAELPENGQLSDDASVSVQVQTAGDTEPVIVSFTVSVAETSTNAGLEDLTDDLNAAWVLAANAADGSGARAGQLQFVVVASGPTILLRPASTTTTLKVTASTLPGLPADSIAGRLQSNTPYKLNVTSDRTPTRYNLSFTSARFYGGATANAPLSVEGQDLWSYSAITGLQRLASGEQWLRFQLDSATQAGDVLVGSWIPDTDVPADSVTFSLFASGDTNTALRTFTSASTAAEAVFQLFVSDDPATTEEDESLQLQPGTYLLKVAADGGFRSFLTTRTERTFDALSQPAPKDL
ncbi:MAG: hypothetical protein ABGZ17_24870, partial [Planctomycetaceae bacterium]